MKTKLALIGFGEAAETFASAADWGQLGNAFDIDPARLPAISRTGLGTAQDAASALKEANVVLSLVTADQALPAALDYAEFLEPATLWFDMNSVAPATKRAAAAAIESRQSHYIDAALLSPVQPAALDVPVLLSGPQAETALGLLRAIGFRNIDTVGPEIGRASAIKMIRSIMVKGIEALTDEMMQSAKAAGVVEDVLASLDRSEKSASWADKAAYNLERMATHGSRRAAEMEEVAKTLEALGVEPLMTNATVVRQRDAATGKTISRSAA